MWRGSQRTGDKYLYASLFVCLTLGPIGAWWRALLIAYSPMIWWKQRLSEFFYIPLLNLWLFEAIYLNGHIAVY